ncbi:MAG: hypothetical protein V1816_14980 [Pseudomonadota bacterium]
MAPADARLPGPESNPYQVDGCLAMKLAVTIDVEEEGLFTGSYSPNDASAENVSLLSRLDPIFRDFGVRPTLLVSYQAARTGKLRDYLAELNEKWGGEIGAHLHHWNTPPLWESPLRPPTPSELMPRELLAEKMETLLDLLAQMGRRPTSFRMGRYNLGPKMFSVLETSGITVDSSISPTRRAYAGPDHLSAPTDPYYPDPLRPTRPGQSKILEVPITVLPAAPGQGRILELFGGHDGFLGRQASWISKNLGSIPAQPVWTGLRRMQTAARLHRLRGGRMITIFFHSSELLPGASPNLPNQAAVDALLLKISLFLEFLVVKMNAASLALSDLPNLFPRPAAAG